MTDTQSRLPSSPTPDHGLQWRDASLAAGQPTHPDSECQWKPSMIYPGFAACLREPVAHYREIEGRSGG